MPPRGRIAVVSGAWGALEVTRGLRAGERVIPTLSSSELAEGVTVRPRTEEGGPARSVAR